MCILVLIVQSLSYLILYFVQTVFVEAGFCQWRYVERLHLASICFVIYILQVLDMLRSTWVKTKFLTLVEDSLVLWYGLVP